MLSTAAVSSSRDPSHAHQRAAGIPRSGKSGLLVEDPYQVFHHFPRCPGRRPEKFWIFRGSPIPTVISGAPYGHELFKVLSRGKAR